MRIDGKKIADRIKFRLKSDIETLKKRGIIPKIAIITLGEESSWEVYVRQKIKVAAELGIKAVLLNLEDADQNRLLTTIETLDKDENFHGIIVQRPLPEGFDKLQVVNSIKPIKDIDGFRKDSLYQVPLWLAVKNIIELSLKKLYIKKGFGSLKFVVIGKGETAGRPVISGLKNLGVEPVIIDSTSQNREGILKKADVVITCVGKPHVVTGKDLKQRSILVGVGIHGEGGKARGDYEEEGLDKLNGTYTPTPGGVGPINLAYLFSNLIEAAKKQNI